jgi:hypothetical protein
MTVAGAIQVIRALPVVRRWVVSGVKPWACDLCMSWWIAFLFAGAAGALVDPRWTLATLPAVAISVWMTGRMKVPTAPPEMPELEDRDDGA